MPRCLLLPTGSSALALDRTFYRLARGQGTFYSAGWQQSDNLAQQALDKEPTVAFSFSRVSDVERALIVDDDPMVCEILATMLKSSGFEPESHVHPQTALAGLKGDSYRIAFLDVNLPDMTGLDLYQSLQNVCKIESAIFMSSSDSFDQVLQAIKLGAYDYLKSPSAPANSSCYSIVCASARGCTNAFKRLNSNIIR